MTKMLKGIAASDGIAAAKAYMLVQPDLSFSETSISDPEAEIKRLDDAVAASKSELEAIKQKAAQNLGAEEAEVFEAHLTILADPEMIGQIENQIKNEKVNHAHRCRMPHGTHGNGRYQQAAAKGVEPGEKRENEKFVGRIGTL